MMDMAEDGKADAAAPESAATGDLFRHVITLRASKSPSGLFWVDSPEVPGLIVHGADLNEALDQIEAGVSALAAAGCPQAQAAIERANAPVPERALPRVSPPQLHVVAGPGGRLGYEGALAPQAVPTDAEAPAGPSPSLRRNPE
jgi:hypothetical protein